MKKIRSSPPQEESLEEWIQFLETAERKSKQTGQANQPKHFAKEVMNALGYEGECQVSAKDVLALIAQRLTHGEAKDLIDLLNCEESKERYWKDSKTMHTVMRYMKDESGKPTYTLDEKVAIYADDSMEGQQREIEWEADQLRHFKEHGLTWTAATDAAGKELGIAPDTVRSRMKKIKYQTQWLEFKKKLSRKT